MAAFHRSAGGAVDVPLTALGNAVGTGTEGLSAEVVEIRDFAELKLLGKEKIAGKIVFFNIPMDATLFNTFAAYGKAGRQRGSGPSEAAKIRSNRSDHPLIGFQY